MSWETGLFSGRSDGWYSVLHLSKKPSFVHHEPLRTIYTDVQNIGCLVPYGVNTKQMGTLVYLPYHWKDVLIFGLPLQVSVFPSSYLDL